MRGSMETSRGIVNGFAHDRLRELSIKLLGDSKSIHLLDVYWAVESWFDLMLPGNIHPPQPMVNAHIEYLLDVYGEWF